MTREERIAALRSDLTAAADLINSIAERAKALLCGDDEAPSGEVTLLRRRLPTEEDFDPILAHFDTVGDWYREMTGNKFRTWEDLPTVNFERERHGLPTFKRDFSRRPR